jgi:cytidylate kinase
VEVVDSTHLDFDQTVDAVLGVIQTALRAPAVDPLQTGARDGR